MTASTFRCPSARVLAVLGVLALAPAPALADPPAADTPAGRPAGEITSYAFDDDLVQGGTVGPGGEVLLVRRRNERESLIRVRAHFVPELLKSAEDL